MPCLYQHWAKTGTQFHFLSIFEKKYKEAKITSQSSSINSNFVGIIIPFIECSVLVSVHMYHKEKEKLDLWLCTHSSPTGGWTGT